MSFFRQTVRGFRSGLIMRRRETLTPFGATALQDQPAILGSHPRAEAMRLGAATIVRLKGSFRHS